MTPEIQSQKSRALCELAPVIPVLVVADASKAEGLATALVAGGLPVLEVTLRTRAALEVIRDAAARWRGGDRQWAEGDSDAIRLALRGRDPFADGASRDEFARITGLVFGAVTRGEPAAIDIGDAEVPDDDAEDAA